MLQTIIKTIIHVTLNVELDILINHGCDSF